jgi:hypothetical protein
LRQEDPFSVGVGVGVIVDDLRAGSPTPTLTVLRGSL